MHHVPEAVVEEALDLLLLGPSQTPEFSAIENLFGDVKRRLKFYRHRSHLETAKKVAAVLLGQEGDPNQPGGYTQQQIEGFFNHSLRNMVQFWNKLDRSPRTELEQAFPN